MSIAATISGRILSIDAGGEVVAGNDYPMTITYDSEWSGTAYVRVRFGSYHYDIPTTVSSGAATVQMPIGYPEVGIGIFSETLGICTNEARIRVTKCILESGTEPVEFDDALYDQWENEVTSLLTDTAFDDTSNRPIANRVVAALDSSALKKDLSSSQTVQGPVVFDGTVKAQSAWVHAAYGTTSVAKNRYLELFTFSRPSGTAAVRLRVSYRESARHTVIELGNLRKSGDEAFGSIAVESNWADVDTYVLGYNASSDSYEVYLHAGVAGSRSLVVTVEGAVSTATGSQIKVVGLASTITNTTAMATGTAVLEEVNAVDTGFNLTMGRTTSSEAYPNWRPIWQAAVNTTSGTSVCGVFIVSVVNPLGGYHYGICQLSQRTATTPALRFEWMCAAGIDPSSFAIVQQDGYVQLWAKQTERYQGPCAVCLTGWRNYSSLGTVWAQPESTEPVADLPSGAGVYSALSILNGTQGVMGLMTAPAPGGSEPTDEADGEEQR